MTVFDRYLEQAKDFTRKLVRAETGTRRWATVTAVDPVRITYDGTTTQGIISPVVLGVPVNVGDRVRAHTIHDKTYITRANPTPEQTNGHIQGGSEQSIPNASSTTITFPGATPDLQGGMTWAGGAFTVPSEGIYSMTANYRFKGPAGGNRGMYIVINGSNSAGNYSPNGIVGHTLSASLVRQLSAGDTISLQVYQTSGSASTTEVLWGIPNLSVSRIG